MKACVAVTDEISRLDTTSRWQRFMEAAAYGDGYLQPLGQHHLAFFVKARSDLLISFDTADSIRNRADTLPQYHAMARARNWSHLCVISEGETWWRDPAVFRFFDQLVDDGVMDNFERVVFYGEGPAGYAAAAYSAAAPGCEVVLIAPRATLDPEIAPWDDRHPTADTVNFTGRYGYAPDMTEAADRVWLIHDPHNPLDARHAALFDKPWVTPLLARHTGENTEDILIEMRIFDKIVEAAIVGTLSTRLFARLWRGRRSNASYLRDLLSTAETTGHPKREAMICRSVTQRLNAPRFARRLAKLTGQSR